MRGSPALAALMAGSALCLATGVAAQDACDLLQSRSSTVQLTRDAIYNYISEPVFGCEGGIIIRADSAELNDASGFTRFIGNFEYRDSTAFMTADRADHFASAGRLIGVGNVHITDEATGAVFEGDSTVLVGSSSRRAGGELTIVGLDGRRAHAVILVSPQAVAPDSSETLSDSAAMPTDSASTRDSTGAVSDSVTGRGQDLNTPVDSAGTGIDAIVPESGPAPPDSTGAAGDSPTAVSDSAQTPTDSPPPGPAPIEPPDSAATLSDSASLAAAPPAAPDPPPRDTTPVPYDIDAEHIYLRGAGYLLAIGNAELYNDEFRALADSIEYREAAGKLFLRGAGPRVYGFGAEYVLTGNAVDLDMDGNQVMARGDAALSGSEINLTAPEIRVLMQDGVLDRIVAMSERPLEPELPESAAEVDAPQGDSGTVTAAGAEEATAGETVAGTAPGDEPPGVTRAAPAGLVLRDATTPAAVAGAGETDASQPTTGEPGDTAAAQPAARPRAVAETFELEGDSIEVEAPNEVLERVVAVGNARGESLARDSLNTENTPEIARSDWVSGDTIIAIFQPVATAEASPEAATEPVAGATGGGYRIDRLVARGQAASLYRMSPSADGGEGEEEAEEGADTEAAETEQADPAQQGAGDEVPGEEVPEEQAAAETAPEEDVAPEVDPVAEQEAALPDASAGRDEVTEGEAEQPPQAEEPPEIRLALHYVRGDLITIFMQGGEVTSVVVEGDARGIQLEPVAPPPPDSTASAPPSTRR